MTYAVKGKNATSFLIVHGTEDDIVDRAQSDNFLLALKQAASTRGTSSFKAQAISLHPIRYWSRAAGHRRRQARSCASSRSGSKRGYLRLVRMTKQYSTGRIS